MTRIAGKLGKTPAKPRPKDIKFSDVVEKGISLPLAPVGFGHYAVIAAQDWGMLGNDAVGDCVEAAAGHETEMINLMNGRKTPFDEHGVLSDYSAITGYNPADPNTDQGTDMHDALNYRIKTGVIDAAGNRHKIGAYVSLEPGNFRQTLEALRCFDFVEIGFEFPDYAMDEFNAGKPWAFEQGGNIDGGHDVPIVGRSHAWTLIVVTWGQIQPMSRKFFETYCDEAYGIVTTETLSAGGVTPEGLNIDALNAALAAL